jgi:hypothetical protein
MGPWHKRNKDKKDIVVVKPLSDITTNLQGAICPTNGKAYSIEHKQKVALAVVTLATKHGGIDHVTPTMLSNQERVSRNFARKIIGEVRQHRGVVDPKSIRQNGRTQNRPVGFGSETLSEEDKVIIKMLRQINSQRTLKSYRWELCQMTGHDISESTICRWFLYEGNFKASLVKTDKVPVDKFTDENFSRTLNYISLISGMDSQRVKFADEKHLRGVELFNKKSRRDPDTGKSEGVIVSTDYRNVYNITGFCCVDALTPCFHFEITQDTNDAISFSVAVENAINGGFLRRGDILVLDNAAIHVRGYNRDLKSWLWQEFNITLVLLPTRSPQYNPIEKMWNTLVMRLQSFHIPKNLMFTHITAKLAVKIMQQFTHKDVAKSYVCCGYKVDPKLLI